MTDKTIQKTRKSLLRKFIFWSLTNQGVLESNDKKIVNSLVMNCLVVLGLTVFGAKAFRKILFRT